MSKETKPKRTRSTKKVTEEGHTAELEAKIAELEAKLAKLSTEVAPETRPAQTSAKPAPKPEPAKPRPAASGPTHGTLPAGMKPAPKPEPKPEPTYTPSEPTPGEVAPAYAQISSSGYTGNRYYATRARLAYHPPNKQYKGSTVSQSTTAPPTPAQSYEPEPAPSTQRGTLPAGTKQPEKKSMWKAKGAEYENYEPQEKPRPAPRPAEPEPAKPRPAASGPTHGTLPAGMKPAPKPEPKPEPTYTPSEPTPGEVAPAYAQISSSGYTGNRYYATRARLAYHPPNKQFTGSSTTTETAQTPEPPKPKSTFRTTLPAGYKA